MKVIKYCSNWEDEILNFQSRKELQPFGFTPWWSLALIRIITPIIVIIPPITWKLSGMVLKYIHAPMVTKIPFELCIMVDFDAWMNRRAEYIEKAVRKGPKSDPRLTLNKALPEIINDSPLDSISTKAVRNR